MRPSFKCSDDGIFCMYDTYDCSRIGVLKVKEGIKSMDVTKNSNYVIFQHNEGRINRKDCAQC